MSQSNQHDTTTLALMLGERVVESTQTHPLTTVAGAALAGWVLARGMPKFAVRIGLSAGLRLVGARVMDELAQLSQEPEPSPQRATTSPSPEVTRTTSRAM